MLVYVCNILLSPQIMNKIIDYLNIIKDTIKYCETFSALCPKGYASETGLALFITGPPVRKPSGCQACPSGYFQENEGQRYCSECPNQAKSRENREGTVSVFECEEITRINWNATVLLAYIFMQYI